jgi:hypothetical protein
MQSVLDTYQVAGYNVLHIGKMVDIIAQRGKKLHFVKVVTPATIDKYRHGFKNNFVQNAFSNGAIPVYAMVDGGIKFEDQNTNARVVVKARVVKNAATANTATAKHTATTANAKPASTTATAKPTAKTATKKKK